MQYLVPKFTLTNYTQLMGSNFQGYGADRWSLQDMWRALCSPNLIQRFALLDARKLWTDLQVPATEKIQVWNVTMKLSDFIIACKLLIPSLWTCDYFFWNITKGTHTGIDIILPKLTPLMSFTSGKVTRIKTRDGVTSNEWNCVVIQDSRGYFRWYEHLDRIDVSLWQNISSGDQIGLCGMTWNSTQYHLHLQVDLSTTKPNPHRSNSIPTIQQKTIDPVYALRAVLSSITDLPYDEIYQRASIFMIDKQYIQWNQWKIFPDQPLQRYEMALLLHRILTKRWRYAQLTQQTTTSPTYPDVWWNDPELTTALKKLRQYGLMKWYGSGLFWPFDHVLSEQVLALLGRSFFDLQDATSGTWYATYVSYFLWHQYISPDRPKLGKPLLRKDFFLLCEKVFSTL